MNVTTPRRIVTGKKEVKNSTKEIIYISEKTLSLKNSKQVQSFFKNEKILENSTKNKPLYIIELPKISSKYVGETEKNLNKILKITQKKNSVLLFDEVAALFGKRSNVKDSNDKFSNIETNDIARKFQKYKETLFITANSKKPISKQDIDKLDCIFCIPIKDRNK